MSEVDILVKKKSYWQAQRAILQDICLIYLFKKKIIWGAHSMQNLRFPNQRLNPQPLHWKPRVFFCLFFFLFKTESLFAQYTK